MPDTRKFNIVELPCEDSDLVVFHKKMIGVAIDKGRGILEYLVDGKAFRPDEELPPTFSSASCRMRELVDNVGVAS